MKKEVIIAVLIGLAMGLIITYGFYRVRTSVTTPKPVEKTQDADTDKASSVLSIHSPDNDLVLTENSVTVAGTTSANAFVVIFVNEEEFITNSDESGNFSLEVELEEGANLISVVVADNDGNTYSQDRTVVVSDLLEQLDEDTNNDDSTESGTIENNPTP